MRDSCTLTIGERAIDTNLQNNVTIEGPGLITQFNEAGIDLNSNRSTVKGMAITSTCSDAIDVFGKSNTVTDNSISRAGLDTTRGLFAGIFVAGSGSHKILQNEADGAGFMGYGIFVGESGSPSTNNVISVNSVSANPTAGIFISTGSTGNTISSNQVLGGITDGDIFDQNGAGNTYTNNLCQVSTPSICKIPPIIGHQNANP